MERVPLAQLASLFLRQAILRADWTHLAHLSVGAWHVDRFGPAEALERLRAGIRALNERHGTANTATGGYHETVTAAYVRLMDEFLSACEGPTSLERRVELLVSSPLADRALLLRFWSKDLLMSAGARARWTPPDLRPLTLPDDARPPRAG